MVECMFHVFQVVIKVTWITVQYFTAVGWLKQFAIYFITRSVRFAFKLKNIYVSEIQIYSFTMHGKPPANKALYNVCI